MRIVATIPKNSNKLLVVLYTAWVFFLCGFNPHGAFCKKLREGLEIEAGNLLNLKEEFRQGAVVSTRVKRGFGR